MARFMADMGLIDKRYPVMASNVRAENKVCMSRSNPARLTDLHMWGIDFHRAPTDVREKVYLDPERINAFQRAFVRESCGVASVVLCTCNRTEIYLEVRGGCGARSAFRSALEDAGVEGRLLMGAMSTHLVGIDAVGHLYRVASGLESMVLGECEIVGQVRRAYRMAERNHERPGVLLPRAFQGALRVGKRVRTETAIGAGPMSVAAAAVEEAHRTLGDLSECRGLLLGAGKTGSLAARHFLKRGVGTLTIVNRSLEKAQELVESVRNGSGQRVRARPFSEMESALAEADVVLTATGSARPIIDVDVIKRCLRNRGDSALHLFDIAVPRDVHPDVRGFPGVRVTGIDELSGLVRGYEAERMGELPQAEKLIREELEEFESWSKTFSIKPTVLELRSHLESLAEKEMGYVRRKQPAETAEVVEESLRTFIGKLLQHPARQLRTAASETERRQDLESLARLFDLGLGAPDPPGAEH